MSAWKYKSLTSKVIVRKLRLIKQEDMADLAGRSLQDILPVLKRTPYQTEISEIPVEQRNSVSLEKAFLKNLIRTYRGIMRDSPKDIALLLSAVLMKFEANNVKAILRAKNAELDVGEALKFITPTERLDEIRCQQILHDCKNIRDVVESLSDFEYRPALEEALREYEKTGVFLILEIALDKYVYGKIWRAARKLRGLDGKIARMVLGIEIDSINVKAILRCKAMGISEDQTRRCLMVVSEVFGEKEWEDALRAADIKSSIEYLMAAARLASARDYGYILTDLQKGYAASPVLSRLETILDRGLLKTSLKMVKRYTPYYNIGLILAFLNLKWFEVKNLTAVTRGVEAGIAPEKIRKLLILPG